MPTAEELLSKLQEIDDSHKNDKKSFIDPLNSERDRKVFYEKSQSVNQFLLPKDMEDKEELLELCQINYQQLENAQKDHLTIFRPQLKDAWQNLAKRIVKKIKRYGQLNDDTTNYANGCGFDPNSDNLDPVDIKETQGVGVPKSLGDVKGGLNILKDVVKDTKSQVLKSSFKETSPEESAPLESEKLKWHEKPIIIILLLIFFFPLGLYFMWKNGMWSKSVRLILTSIFVFIVIANMDFSSDDTVNSRKKLGVPNSQQIFIDEWLTIKDGYNNSTSVKQKQFKDKGYKFLKENKSKVEKWFGKVTDVTTNRDGEIIVVVFHKGIEYELNSRTGSSSSLSTLDKGNEVIFSGYLIGESSLTTSGAISAPELKVVLNELTSTDLSNIFFKSSNKSAPPPVKGVINQKISNGILTAYLYVDYNINADYCARDIMETAFKLSENNPSINTLKLDYGIKYRSNKGDNKEEHVGTFIPDLNKLREYKSSFYYVEGESIEQAMIGLEFYNKGFK